MQNQSKTVNKQVQNETTNQYINRYKSWFYSCLNICAILKITDENIIFKKQLIRSSSGAYVNYRSVARAKSGNDMINKLKIVEEELDESFAWLEIISERNSEINAKEVLNECETLLKMVVSSIKTLRNKNKP